MVKVPLEVSATDLLGVGGEGVAVTLLLEGSLLAGDKTGEVDSLTDLHNGHTLGDLVINESVVSFPFWGGAFVHVTLFP